MKLPELNKKQKILTFSILGVVIAAVIVVAVIVVVVNSQNYTPETSENSGTEEMIAEKEAEKSSEKDSKTKKEDGEAKETDEPKTESEEKKPVVSEPEPEEEEPVVGSGICPRNFGRLMLINPNFTVDTGWIALRRTQLIDISEVYGIEEGNVYNGAPLMEPEAASHLNDMLTAYKNEMGGEMTTRSCFRSRGTSCGRLCYPTGTSDHHTGLTCDLIDDQYGNSLDTSTYDLHPEWQWLYANSYKYGFIDRFPYEWAGGPMSAPVNVDENGSTGLYETWHYRYVGITAATEIATGKYNNGQYDSLEHYLKAIGLIPDLLGPADCE